MEKYRIVKDQEFCRTIYNAVSSPILVVDEDVRIIDYNRAAELVLGPDPEQIIRRRAGEVLHCLNAGLTPEGCGHATPCRDCVIRGSVNQCLATGELIRQKARLELTAGEKVEEVYFLVSAAPFSLGEQKLVVLILEDIGELVELRRLLPICSYCKRVRDDEELWQQVDVYLNKHLEVDFSHGLCPECIAKYYPEVLDDDSQ